MNTKRAVTCYGDIPIEMWNDPAEREPFWGRIRSAHEASMPMPAGCTRFAGEIDRTVIYRRSVEAGDGWRELVETTPDKADRVLLRLRVWAEQE